MNEHGSFEHLLSQVEVPGVVESRRRALAAIPTRTQRAASRSSRRRWLRTVAGIVGAGALALSPVGEAIADLVSGGSTPSPPPLTAQEREISMIACLELGERAKGVSWCDEAGGSEAEIEALLQREGYELFTEGPIIAVKSPDGSVLVTGTGDGPEAFDGVDFPIRLWGGWLAGPTDQDALDLADQLRGSPVGGTRAQERKRSEQSR